MTRAEAVTHIKNLLFEDAASTGIATTAQFNTTVDIANQAVWHKAVALAPSMFTTTSADTTYSASTGYFDVVPTTYFLVTRVDIKVGTEWMALDPSFPQDQAYMDATSVQPAGVTPVGYWMDGTRLKLLPRPASDQTIRIVYVPALPALGGDADVLLAARMPEFHSLVAYEAAMVLAAKDEASATFQAVKVIRDELYKSFLRHLSRRSAFRSHSIREVPFL